MEANMQETPILTLEEDRNDGKTVYFMRLV